MDISKQLLIEQRVANESKSPLVAYLLLFLLWGFGFHRIYLGRWMSGVIMMLMWGFGLLTSPILIGFPFLAVVSVWVIIDAFLIPSMINNDKDDIRRRLEVF